MKLKYVFDNIRISISGFDQQISQTKGKEIQAFNIVILSRFNSGFGNNKKIIILIEKILFEYYAEIVQHFTNWNQSASKLVAAEKRANIRS